MDRLRPRQRLLFSGFTNAEVEKMEKVVAELGGQLVNREFCQKIARSFNSSSGRAGKPIIKWTEVQNWFHSRLQESTSKVASSTDGSKNESVLRENCPPNKESGGSREMGEKILNLEELEFEARSSKDGAWYDVDTFLCHRYTCSGEAEVRVRFIGFGVEEDEWVNVKKAVRERSIPLEHTECHKLKIGDLVLCFQERRDQAIYYDAHIKEIQRRMHDIRGCRCLFLIQYDHDNSEERVRLRRLCRRPTY